MDLATTMDVSQSLCMFSWILLGKNVDMSTFLLTSDASKHLELRRSIQQDLVSPEVDVNIFVDMSTFCQQIHEI